jgi:hypothetical protein
MNRSNADNIRIKRDYFAHLKGPGRQSEASIDAVAKALSRFESYTRNKDFKTFRKEQAIGFTADLSRQISERTGEPLSKATLPMAQFERFNCRPMNLFVALQVREIEFDQAPKRSKAFAQPFQSPQRRVAASFWLIDVAEAVSMFIAHRKKSIKHPSPSQNCTSSGVS